MPQKYWFKTHKVGFGWRPVTWQGWIVIALYLIAVTYSFLEIDSHSHSASDTFINFLPQLFIFSAILIIISYLKGEPVNPS